MANLADRFEAKVDRSGAHHDWLGARKADGTGLLKVEGRMVTAHRVAWELKNGPLPRGVVVKTCPELRSCVRVEHLTTQPPIKVRKPTRRIRQRASRGTGSKTKLRDGVWKLTVSAGRYADGRRRTEHQVVHVDGDEEATRELARFVAEVHDAPPPATQTERDMLVDAAIDRYLAEYLVQEKGREANTITAYRTVHRKWFAPVIGQRRVRDVDEAAIDRIFGKMRAAGLSASRLHDARNLYAPFFRWAKRRNIIRRNPMVDFELPTSSYVAKERIPPEVDQLCRYLEAAVEYVPDVAPMLVLDAVTGMRRGELVTLRRSRLKPAKDLILVDVASDGTKVKTTKTRETREVTIDAETMAMLLRHCDLMDKRAADAGVEMVDDPFLFSREDDCSKPMSPRYLTERVAELKDHLGIPDKSPETIKREDQALRLRRTRLERAAGRSGPKPSARGMSYADIGRTLGRSEGWAQNAVASAERREAAEARGKVEDFDGSILAIRKFTSNELLDAGFNIKAVAQHQGHGPEVLVKFYAKRRRSADRKAAAHLAKVVHGHPKKALSL
jgi:site-specific recombinase XerD